MSDMDELAAWLREQLDVDDAEADAILSPPPGHYDKGWQADGLRQYAMRTLALTEALRSILDSFSWEAQETRAILTLAKALYADRPGYREEWRP